jgi:hypothetical protein
MDHVVPQAQKKHRFLRRFADGWPVRDYITRFLQNHTFEQNKQDKQNKQNKASKSNVSIRDVSAIVAMT